METLAAQPAAATGFTPRAAYHWLRQLVGAWTYETETLTHPDQPPEVLTGTEVVRRLGDYWIVAEGEGEVHCGGPTATTLLTLGYDPARQRFVGTWVGSIMPQLWVYEGTLNADATILTLDCVGPSFEVDGKTTQYRDVIELGPAGQRALKSHMLREDGTWLHFMTMRYRRTP